MSLDCNIGLKSFCVAAAFMVLWGTGAWAAAPAPADSEQAKAKLAAVRARIAALTNRLGAELQERDALSSRLRAAELVIAAKRQRFDALRAERIAAERHRAQLRGEQTATQNELRAERAALGEQVRAAYMIGRQEELKLLLNQRNPAGIGRTLAYYGYFVAERSNHIETIQGREQRLRQLVTEIDQQSAQLQILENEASRDMAAIQQARVERIDALAALSKQVTNGNQELANLKREEEAVESLVDELARFLQDFPVDATGSFDGMRGRLPWPVLGRVTAHYQHGEMIEAIRGAKVRAPYFGRVVYADWLQGLGLLLIIGHGGGYMTLYGHAEVLYKSVGDWVAPGDVIAALSDANGAAPQLYFEIRQGRKTVDPKNWLKTHP
jgi:septal ring factor EnvC (AmiA/AmiB activator)